jgi:acyl carrier protein
VTPRQILDRVTAVVADTLGLDELALTPETTAADVEGWDSLAHVQIIVAVEREFGVRFRTGEIATIKDVGDLVARVGHHVGIAR